MVKHKVQVTGKGARRLFPLVLAVCFGAWACSAESSLGLPMEITAAGGGDSQPSSGGQSTAAAGQPADGGDTQCVTYQGCPTGIELTACTVDGGGHCWFGSEDCGTGGGAIGMAFVGNNSDTLVSTTAVWNFFTRTSP